MKKFIRFCLCVICGAFVLYAAYLVFEKFIKADSDKEDDLYEDGTISFGDRVKKAAEKQLEKIG